ncbi:DUF3263 domain-containing protein [Rhodococcus sp. IEGM 248]|nr:DUF3263 domain-containing protein [Rhodococcus sp. IEGM 248]RZK93984.1 MAG: DUF3263 domain-containing protein [Rhodococcus sp. (in: high G+C Gram-positive bacteria)]
MSATETGGRQGETPDLQIARTTPVEMEIRRYRRWRDRRREAERRRTQLPERSREVEDILTFARRWAPYGGPSEEDIFVNFGMSTKRFEARVKQILDEIGCDSLEEHN